MLLDQLKNSGEKKSFMQLAYWVAAADGSLGLPEIKMLDIFSKEMGVAGQRLSGDKPSLPLVCSVFSDELSRKIAFSNLTALCYSEDFENDGQTHALKKIQEALNISQENAKEYRDWMKIVKGSYFPKYYMD